MHIYIGNVCHWGIKMHVKLNIQFLSRRFHSRFLLYRGLLWSWSYGSLIYNYLSNRECLSPLLLWVRTSIRARCTTLCDEVCQWLVTSRWFFPGTPVSSTNITDRHNIAEILFIVALKQHKTNKKNNIKLDIQFLSIGFHSRLQLYIL